MARESLLAKVFDAWYIACHSHELGKKPLAVTILDTPLVLFRGPDGEPTALLDRCAHRNVPLSCGKVIGGQIECAYHGWRFDNGGICRTVPALLGEHEGKARRVPRYVVREQQGYVWVYMREDVVPTTWPYEVPHLGDPRYMEVRYDFTFNATMRNVAENALDVPHTAFLHKGLFRGGKKNRITAVVTRAGDRVTAEYIGEPRPGGVVAKLLAPGGGTVKHYDRFILPSIAQVEYGLGKDSHLLLTSVLTPVREFETKMFAVACVRLPVASNVAKRVLTPIAKRIILQDAEILAKQTAVLQRFGGEQFVSTDVDILGSHILRLLRQAERGEVAVDAPVKESSVEFLA